MADGTPEAASIPTIEARLGTQKIGAVKMAEVRILCANFGMSRTAGMHLLLALRVPLFHIGPNTMYNQTALERILYVLTRYGGPGFAAPGSAFKTRGNHKKDGYGKPVTEISDDLIKKAQDPMILAEMAASTSLKMNTVSTMAKLLKDAKK